MSNITIWSRHYNPWLLLLNTAIFMELKKYYLHLLDTNWATGTMGIRVNSQDG